MQCPGHHTAGVDYEQANNRMHLENRALHDRTIWDVILKPVFVRPERHDPCYAQARRDRQAFEIGRFAIRIFRDVACCDVKARESRKACEDEAGK